MYLPVSLYLTLQSFFLLIGFFLLISLFSIYVFVLNIILMIYFISIVMKYTKTSGNLKSITSIARSHVISQIIQMKKALVHIRSSNSDSYI
jgi:hypothetical protein